MARPTPLAPPVPVATRAYTAPPPEAPAADDQLVDADAYVDALPEDIRSAVRSRRARLTSTR